MVIKEIEYTDIFKKEVKKLNKGILSKIKKQIKKIINNPEIGKPLKYSLKGERSLRVTPYRLVYSYQNNKLVLLGFRHRKGAYSH